ncbi:MAG: hypothetical protein ABJA71_09795 [Ginsengibacter sp.]
MKKTKMMLLVPAIVIELAAVIMITKAYVTHSSPTNGLTFLAIGLVFLVIGITRKSEEWQVGIKLTIGCVD